MSEEPLANPDDFVAGADAALVTADPVEPDDADEADSGVEGDEPELDDNGEPVVRAAEPEDDTEEIEHDGQKYKLPKALKPALLMQADYTRKTMALAEDARALAAERQAFVAREAAIAEAAEEVRAAHAKVAVIDARFDDIRNEVGIPPDQIDWDAWASRVRQLRANGQHDEATADQFEMDTTWRRIEALKTARAAALTEAENKATGANEALTQAQREEHAKLLAEGAKVLARDIPDWGPELGRNLVSFGVEAFGFSPDEINGITDPRMVKALHAAFLADKAKKEAAKVADTKKTVQTIEAKQAVKVAPVVSGGQATTRPSTATPAGDRLPMDAWAKAERERVARLRKRA